MTEPVPILRVETDDDRQAADALYWEVLWKPLGLPRDVRRTFNVPEQVDEWTAQIEGRVVGAVAGAPDPPAEYELHFLAVYPDFQRQGVGQALVRELLRHAADSGARTVHAVVRNSAVPFYQGLGFMPRGDEVKQYPAFLEKGIRLESWEYRL